MSIDEDNLPLVSAIIPMRNEQGYIFDCLESIAKGNYPLNKLEILIADGMSTDGSINIINKASLSYPFLKVSLVENPKRIVSTGLNLAILKSKGEIIVRLDSHAVYDNNYIIESVKLLLTSDAANVGGIVRPVGKTFIGKSIAIAMGSPLGFGNAKYRYTERPVYTDAVWAGCWYKKTLLQIGLYNEDWIVNQDAELNNRIRQSGKNLLVSPDIKCRYFVRESYLKLIKQYFRYGFWRAKTNMLYPEMISLRQMIPVLFILVVFLSLLITSYSLLPLVSLFTIYGLALIISSIKSSMDTSFSYFPFVLLALFIIHFSWGLGYWVRLLKSFILLGR